MFSFSSANLMVSRLIPLLRSLSTNTVVNQRLQKLPSGEFEKELKAMAAAAGLSGKITFLGHVDNRDMLNTLFRTHHIFCFASLSEGSPRVVLEAMANGINVLSTPVGSLPSVFKEGVDITYAGFNDDQGFFKKICYLVENPEEAYAVGNRAQEKVRGFTIQHFIKNIFSYES